MNLFEENKKDEEKNLNEDIENDEFELSASDNPSLPKSKFRLSNSSSISNLNEKKNPLLIYSVVGSSGFLLLSSFLSVILSLVKAISPLFFFKHNEAGVMVYLSIVLICISNILICVNNGLFCKFILVSHNEKIISIVQSTLKYFFPSINLILGVCYILGCFRNEESIAIPINLIILSLGCIVLLYFIYPKVKRKRQLDVSSLITVSIYLSALAALFSYSFLSNSSDLIIYKREAARRVRRTVIDVFQLLIGIVLMSYFHDIIFMLCTILFIYTPELIMSTGNKDRNVIDLIVLIALGFSIIFFFFFNAGLAVFGLQKDETDTNLIKMRTVSKASISSGK